MAMIRYDIEVERTVTFTATPQPGNSRHPPPQRPARLWAWLIFYSLISLLIVGVVMNSASPEQEFRHPSDYDPSDDYGKAPDDAKPHAKSKTTKAKPKPPPVERTDDDEEPALSVPNYNGWCGTARLPPVPQSCDQPVWGWQLATVTQKAVFCRRVLQSPQEYPAAVPLCRSYLAGRP
jgi:hypothetical protein